MNDIQLSKNLMLSEFTRSETARRRKINNDAPESVIENLRNLCQNVLQPLRDYVGDFWIHVSCRRDPKLNRHHVVYYMKKN